MRDYLKISDEELCRMSESDLVAVEVILFRWRGAINRASGGDEHMLMYMLERLPARFPKYQAQEGAKFYSWLSRCLSGLRADYRRSASRRVISMEGLEKIPVVDVGGDLFSGQSLPPMLRAVAFDISRGQKVHELKKEWGPVVTDAIIAELQKAVGEQ